MLYWIAIFEVTLNIGDTKKVTKFIASADLKKVFLALFSGEMVGITLTSILIHRMKPLCAKLEVTFVILV